MTQKYGMLTLEQLRVHVDDGSIDTVLVGMTDMQGRLQGKRCDARYFLSEVAGHATEACNYLLAVDVEMNTVGGYAMSSWESGYGDFVLKPDLDTLRWVPWHEATALVLCDAQWADGSPVVASPRQILRRQLDRLAERGLDRRRGHRAGVPALHRLVRRGVAARATATCEPANLYNVDYSMLGTARVEPVLRRIRNGMTGRRAWWSSRPRASATWASTRSRSSYSRSAHDVRQPLDLQERRQGDRRPGRDGAVVHGQVRRAGRQLLPHPHLVALRQGRRTVFPGEGPSTASLRCSSTSSPGSRPCLRELTYLFAPNINSYKRYAARESFAPTAVAWGMDNRTCALRVVGHGQGLRVENRVPGGDVNPYLARRRAHRGGVARHRARGVAAGPDELQSATPTLSDGAPRAVDAARCRGAVRDLVNGGGPRRSGQGRRRPLR